MFKHRITILAALMLSLGGAAAAVAPSFLLSPAVAQNNQRAERPQKGDRQGWMDKLNLTAEQRQKIEAIRNQYKDQMSQQQQAVRQARRELMEMMAGDASADQIRAKHQEVSNLSQQLSALRFEGMLATREVLTPAQRRQLAEMMQQRREKMHKRAGFMSDRW